MTGAGRAFGPYRVGALLGRGQMGEVHRAVDTAHGDRPIALKVLVSAARDNTIRVWDLAVRVATG